MRIVRETGWGRKVDRVADNCVVIGYVAIIMGVQPGPTRNRRTR